MKSSGDDVSLDGFSSAVDVDADRGSVDLSPAGPITHQVTVRAQHGGITLRVPSGSDLTLEADARPGELDVDLPDFVVERKDETGTAGRVGKGGVSVKLAASHGDVNVQHAARGDAPAAPRCARIARELSCRNRARSRARFPLARLVRLPVDSAASDGTLRSRRHRSLGPRA